MKFEIEVQKRDRAGKGAARQLRRSGKIPAVLSGNGQSLLLSMDPKVGRHIVLSQAGHTGLLTVHITGGGKQEDRVAILQDHQIDPVTNAILHVDLFEVSMDKPIRVKVPVTVVGEVPRGVKEGGSLHQPLRDLHIECLPAHIPDHIELDASGLHIGQGIHVREIPVSSGVRVLDDGDLMVVNVAAKISEAKLEALLTREAGEVPPAAELPAAEKEKTEAPSAVEASDEKAKEGKK